MASRTFLATLLLGLVALTCAACVGSSPTPLAPALRGSIGVPHHGVITDAVELPMQGEGYRLLRSNGVRWGTAGLVATVQRAAAEVARARPGGAPLLVGDLSRRFGGRTRGHRSHRTGRDADLLLYALTPDGRPVRSPGFIEFGPDGLARRGDDDGGRSPASSGARAFVRLDVEREWLLVKALLRSPDAHVQWLFLARWLEALVIEYARARGEDPELVWYAESVLLQPGDSTAHADHIHLRVACAPDDFLSGCLGGGPYWPWLPAVPQLVPPTDTDLAAAILEDLLPGGAAAGARTAAPDSAL
ncbi:murein endopeptidase [Sorangium cellulosum]|jgi:penicillin-insensitive murein endopeptidase|uniref:Murein endopeptidase n=1 Tax=Sorangium cellulosum TaxID=56 RepID=A0A4P2QEQ5_SORCE|nr:penicillin-insensitive murein endopeptidase [Sorangium cellulosum]AUX27921.1 murein endopeptidase [Sorangium cellulosum]